MMVPATFSVHGQYAMNILYVPAVPVADAAGPRVFPGTEAKQAGFRVPAVYRHCPAFADNLHTPDLPEPVPVSRASIMSFQHHSSSSGTGNVICLNGIFRSPARRAAISVRGLSPCAISAHSRKRPCIRQFFTPELYSVTTTVP